MNTTNLPARRTAPAVVVATAPPSTAPPARRRRIGFFELLAIAVILAFVAGVMLNLTTT